MSLEFLFKIETMKRSDILDSLDKIALEMYTRNAMVLEGFVKQFCEETKLSASECELVCENKYEGVNITQIFTIKKKEVEP